MRLVAINTDSAEVIAGLYGIGPHLAQRIVQLRQHGFLRGPEDLARVTGISQHLAVTLSPHINWESPTIQVQPKSRRWSSAPALLGFVIMGLLALFPFRITDSLFWGPRMIILAAIGQYRAHNVDSYLDEMIAGIFFAAFYHLWLISMTSFFLAFGLEMVVIKPKLETFVWRLRQLFAGCTVVACGLMCICLPFLPNLLISPLYVLNLVWGFPVTLGIGFMLLLAWRPRLAETKVLVYLQDVSLILIALVAILAIYNDQRNIESFSGLNTGQLIGLALFAFLYLAIGLYGLSSPGTLVENTVDDTLSLAVPRVFATQKADLATWRNWINATLPDARDQEALSRALNRIYPPARTHVIVRFIFLGVGWWLLSNVLSALIQGLVEKKFLEPFL